MLVNLKLSGKFLINFSAIAGAKLWSLNYLKVNYITTKQTTSNCIQTASQNSVSGDLWSCKLAHTSRRNQWKN